jgi:hypothetical protein
MIVLLAQAALLGRYIAAPLPHDALDLLLALSAQILAEASPVEDRESAPQVAANPIFCRLNLTPAHHARIHR